MRKYIYAMVIAIGVLGGWIYLINYPSDAFTTSSKFTSKQYLEDGDVNWADEQEGYFDSLDAWLAGSGSASWGTITATTVFNSNGTANLDTLDVDGASDFGGDINYSDTFWDDFMVAPQGLAVRGSPTIDPDLAAFRGGVYAYAFDASADEGAHFEVQLPHAWKQGTALYPHVHWAGANTNSGVVEWDLEYLWANINAQYISTSSTIAVSDTTSVTLTHSHRKAVFSSISGTGKTMSSILMCRLNRNADAGTDTYTGDAFLLGVDFHIELDSPGSSSELVK